MPPSPHWFLFSHGQDKSIYMGKKNIDNATLSSLILFSNGLENIDILIYMDKKNTDNASLASLTPSKRRQDRFNDTTLLELLRGHAIDYTGRFIGISCELFLNICWWIFSTSIVTKEGEKWCDTGTLEERCSIVMQLTQTNLDTEKVPVFGLPSVFGG